MSNSTFQEIHQVFQDNASFLLVSHIRPDGDAIGSILALGHSLEALGKSVRYLNQDGCPESLAFLSGAEKVEISSEALAKGPIEVDVAIALDTAAHARVGEDSLKAMEGAKILVNIDHHVSNPGYGDYNFIDSTSPATGQILYDLITATDLPLPPATRDSIYVATSTDTGSFRFPATTSRSYEMAADLISKGLEVGKINELTYDTQPFRKVELLRALLNTLELSPDGKVAWWHLTEGVKHDLSLVDDDSEGMIDHIRAVQGVIVAIFFEELGGGQIRVSLRSKEKGIKANEICGIFGGGGHALAAGIRMAGPLSDAKGKLLTEVSKAITATGV